MADRHRQGAPLRGARPHDDPRSDGVHRGPARIVELDALVLLEVAAHRRAVAVGLVDERLVGVRDGAAEDRMQQRRRGAHARGVAGDEAGRRLSAQEAAGRPEDGVARRAGRRRQHGVDVARARGGAGRPHREAHPAAGQERATAGGARAHQVVAARQVAHRAARGRGVAHQHGGALPEGLHVAALRAHVPRAVLAAQHQGHHGLFAGHDEDRANPGTERRHRRRVGRLRRAAGPPPHQPPQRRHPQPGVAGGRDGEDVGAGQRAGAGVRHRHPGDAVVGRVPDAVRRGDEQRVAAIHQAVGGDVLPLGSEGAVLPVLPGVPAVLGDAPPVAHRAVPRGAAVAEGERVHVVEGDAAAGGVGAEALPRRGAGPEEVDALAVGPGPDGAVGRAAQRQDGHAPATRVRQRRQVRRALGERARGERQRGEEQPQRSH